jgi:serine protease Do
VVKINADRVIPAKWGDSGELQKGDWVLAFGSPFRYVGSMTHGIVSAINRRDVNILAPVGGYENFIQVDAAINPGNSGGPLVNIRGEVIGINTAIATRTGAWAGIGFAIPSNQAISVYEQLKSTGKVTRGWLGVAIGDVSAQPGLGRSFGLEDDQGVLVNDTIPGTPAAGKLEKGDIIIALDGKPVDGTHTLRNQIAAKPPGAEVNLTVMRNREKQEVTIQLGEQPENLIASRQSPTREPSPSEEKAADALGLRLTTPNRQQLEMRGLAADQQGAMVANVTPRSPAARAGIRQGDLITEVGEQQVTNAREATDALAEHDLEKDGVRLYVVTRDTGRYVFVQTGR